MNHRSQKKQTQNRYLDFLISLRYQGGNRIFVLLLENKAGRVGHTWYYLPTVEIKHYSVLIDERNFLINLLQMI